VAGGTGGVRGSGFGPDSGVTNLAGKGPEAVWIEANSNGVCIVGKTPLAVRHGTYIYLEQLGYRWFFPNEVWHVVPKIMQVAVPFTYCGEPAFKNRRIWYAYGTSSKKCDDDYKRWVECNRQGGAFEPRCGHAWPGIVSRNKDEFAAHPEYFAVMQDGKRDTNRVDAARKFCVSNEGLVDLCIRDSLKLLGTNYTDGSMVSLDPSDGSGDCFCDPCRKIGREPEQAFHLANRVAKAFQQKAPGAWVGLYAYAGHALPPAIPVERNVYVQVATAFNRTPYTMDQLIAEWGRKVSAIGIREYYGVMAWDWDMPGQPRGANLEYLRKSIGGFREAGANAINAESNIGWISRGLGQYIATRLMWDTGADVEKLEQDFHDKAFGAAASPMKELFDDWQNPQDPVPTPHSIARWYRLVNEAWRLADNDAVRARLRQVQSYLHFVALFHDYRTATAKNERDAYTALLRFAWQVRDSGLCASYPLARRIANSAAPAPEYKFNATNCVWQDAGELTDRQLADLVKADTERFHEVQGLIAFPRTGSFKPLEVEQSTRAINRLRFPHEFVIEVPTEGEAAFTISIGFVYKEVYDHVVKIYAMNEDVDEVNDHPVFERVVRGDGTAARIELGALKPGVYRLVVDDRRSGFEITPKDKTRLTLFADASSHVRSIGRSSFFMCVPAGVSQFVVVADGPMALRKPNGEKIVKPAGNLWEVPVAVGEAGIWRIMEQAGSFYLMGVPPFVAYAPQDLLLPETGGGTVISNQLPVISGEEGAGEPASGKTGEKPVIGNQ